MRNVLTLEALAISLISAGWATFVLCCARNSPSNWLPHVLPPNDFTRFELYFVWLPPLVVVLLGLFQPEFRQALPLADSKRSVRRFLYSLPIIIIASGWFDFHQYLDGNVNDVVVTGFSWSCTAGPLAVISHRLLAKPANQAKQSQ